MLKTKWPIAIPLAIVLLGSTAWGSAIRDQASIFSPGSSRRPGNGSTALSGRRHPGRHRDHRSSPRRRAGASAEQKRERINEVAKRRDAQIHDEGIYILISRDDVISQPLIRARLQESSP